MHFGHGSWQEFGRHDRKRVRLTAYPLRSDAVSCGLSHSPVPLSEAPGALQGVKKITAMHDVRGLQSKG
ncbi:hypothetical protein J2X16_002408 [Pelomonas aquatica]|uniref:Uncharacterized protein n=1 Tax=Pelomonas aquatica TaxID=431058 RepID=A0ABU1ZAL6_9BURK|nr:hypothetical protein [Pelomonas aquatica]